MELVVAVAGAHPQNDPSVRELVQGGHLLRDVDGMDQGADEDPGAQIHVSRSRNETGQQGQGLGDHQVAQVVMHCEHRVESQFGGGDQFHDLLQAGGQRLGALVLEAEKEPEFHGVRD